NKGGLDFQTLKDENGTTLYEKVLQESQNWKNNNQLMYVVGATRPEYFQKIRKIIPNNFLLVPGIGAQGGNLQDVCKYGLNKNIGLLINSSRGIIYASNGKNFAEKAKEKALELQIEMQTILNKHNL
ncbi:MAG: orotidine 5'-phosphate decarboxylase, partial [Flavobacteriaceae bacterium]|nr:orotidine 5'-phosphate decarboxylase [Flavobacteriaceae bacterium]